MALANQEFLKEIFEENGGAFPITLKRRAYYVFDVVVGASQSEIKIPMPAAGTLVQATLRVATLTTGDANLTVTKCGAGQAIAAGTAMTGTLPAKTGTTANTNYNFSLVAGAAANVAVGDAIGIAQSATTAGGVGITVTLVVDHDL